MEKDLPPLGFHLKGWDRDSTGPVPMLRGQESGLGVLAGSPMPAQVEEDLSGPGQ